MTVNVNRYRPTADWIRFTLSTISMLLGVCLSPYSRGLDDLDPHIDPRATFPDIAYIQATNECFSICVGDSLRKVLQRWKGCYVLGSELPITHFSGSFIDQQHVYWKAGQPSSGPAPFNYYNYSGTNRIPYAIEDVDPPLKYIVNQQGTLQIGFVRLYEFYIIMEVQRPSLKTKVPHRRNYSVEWRIAIPPHRVDELKRLMGDLMKNPPDVHLTCGEFKCTKSDK